MYVHMTLCHVCWYVNACHLVLPLLIPPSHSIPQTDDVSFRIGMLYFFPLLFLSTPSRRVNV